MALNLAKLMHLVLMSTNVPLIWYSFSSYFIKLNPIAPVPHPKSTNLIALPFFHFFLISEMASPTKYSVSNRGISIGGFTFNTKSLKAHSPIKYCIGQWNRLAFSSFVAQDHPCDTQQAANASTLHYLNIFSILRAFYLSASNAPCSINILTEASASGTYFYLQQPLNEQSVLLKRQCFLGSEVSSPATFRMSKLYQLSELIYRSSLIFFFMFLWDLQGKMGTEASGTQEEGCLPWIALEDVYGLSFLEFVGK